jgi:hypothetical protein
MAGTNLHQPETILKILEATLLSEKSSGNHLVSNSHNNQTAANLHSFVITIKYYGSAYNFIRLNNKQNR